MTRTRIRAAITAALITTAAAAVAVTTLTGSPSTHHQATPTSLRLAADTPSGVVTYDAQGVTVEPPAATPTAPAPVAATADSVLHSFKAQGVPASAIGSALDTATHTVAEQQVTETLPVTPEIVAGVPYAAWVVTYTGLPPVSYGSGPAPAGVSCTFVGVMSRATGHWTEFFSTCS
jgi:hypothetical protein